MQLLGGLIAGVFSALFGWLGAFLTKRVATYVALTVLVFAAALAAYAAIVLLVGAAASAAPAQLGVAMGWFLPTNIEECIAALLGIEVVVAGYRWHKETVRASAGIT